jgi:Raf kinase inhibitor-like YbhB/YbcL family protein
LYSVYGDLSEKVYSPVPAKRYTRVMTITSTAFQDNDPIPKEYSFDSKNVNPPLTFSETPEGAESLALIIEDPDAPSGTFTHWILYNMSPATLQILEGELPLGAKQATNDFGQQKYGGPKPPSGTHRYFFKLFALDTMLDDLREQDSSSQFYQSIEDHTIGQAQIVGTYAAD